MRGSNNTQTELFSYIPLEHRIPKKHPLRKIREIVDNILLELDDYFDSVYSWTGRPSIPPEMLLKSLFLQILYGIRSEKLLLEQIEFNLLYRWFVGLKPDDKIWDETVFTKNRDRILSNEIIDLLFEKVLGLAKIKKLISDEHFSVDGTLLETWASVKSIRKKDDTDKDDKGSGNGTRDFRGEKISNKTHESKTDPEAKLYKKSKGSAAKLSYMGHILMENRNGLAVNAEITQSGYYAEHEAAKKMTDEIPGTNRITLGADKHYDNEDFCKKLRKKIITPHIAMNIHAKKYTSAIDKRTTRHPGYEISLVKRKMIEKIFGWLKEFSILRRPHFRGMQNIGRVFKYSIIVYNILRIHNLCYSE